MSSRDYRLSFPSGDFVSFRKVLSDRVRSLAREQRLDEFRVPIGLVLVIDEASGGNDRARELVKRFDLLRLESKTYIDFYFLGWTSGEQQIAFNSEAFTRWRDILRGAGIDRFSGNADLVLIDAVYRNGALALDFGEIIQIDVSSPDLPELGFVLESVIEAARVASEEATDSRVSFISDRIGVAFGKDSLIRTILEKFGALIGANKLRHFAVRRAGQMRTLPELETMA